MTTPTGSSAPTINHLQLSPSQFAEEHPLGFNAGDTNLYRYVGNNPTNNVDPSGLQRRDPDLSQAQREYWREVRQREIAELERRFMTWYEAERRDMGWLNRLPAPPNRLEFRTVTVRINPGGLGGRRDPGPFTCEVQVPVLPEGWEWDSTFAMRTLGFHPHATYGIRSRPAGNGAGQQAMYDASGRLITGGLSAGTPDRISPNQDFWAHQREDVDPFRWARTLDSHYGGDRFRRLYLEVRPPHRGVGAPENVVD